MFWLRFFRLQQAVVILTVLNVLVITALLVTPGTASYGEPAASAASLGRQQSGSAATQCEEMLERLRHQPPVKNNALPDAVDAWWAERDRQAQAALPVCRQAAQSSPTPRNRFLYGQAIANASRNNIRGYLGALKQFMLAANAGYAPAMTSIGRLHMFGDLEGEDSNTGRARAAAWFRKGADAGDAEAMCLLAGFYESGQGGLPQSEEKAELWYRKAANAGYVPAIKNLVTRTPSPRRVLSPLRSWPGRWWNGIAKQRMRAMFPR